MKLDPLHFSLLYSAPVLLLLLPPALILMPLGLLTGLVAVLDPSTPLQGVLPTISWGVMPFLLSVSIISAGCFLYRSEGLRTGTWSIKIRMKLVLMIFLFLTLWFDVTLLGSISASDKDQLVYLGTTALLAMVGTLIGVVGIWPWIRFVLGRFPELDVLEKELS